MPTYSQQQKFLKVNLLFLGNYQNAIRDAFARQQRPYSPFEAVNSVYVCDNFEGGITRVAFCGPDLCRDAGPNNSDFCMARR